MCDIQAFIHNHSGSHGAVLWWLSLLSLSASWRPPASSQFRLTN
jgi:hypothetical protein